MTVNVSKTVTGNARPELADDKKEKFEFTLTAIEDTETPKDSEGNTVSTISITDAGTQDFKATASFAAIQYKTADTYYYKLAETKGSTAGYSYDESVY